MEQLQDIHTTTITPHEKATFRSTWIKRFYGTFAEIGAGQEVARWFFRVGGASGTLAKTISAYDMAFSDAIYGKGERYVSQSRACTTCSITSSSCSSSASAKSAARRRRSSSFSDTVSARNYLLGTNECHGWMGIKFQLQPQARAERDHHPRQHAG